MVTMMIEIEALALDPLEQGAVGQVGDGLVKGLEDLVIDGVDRVEAGPGGDAPALLVVEGLDLVGAREGAGDEGEASAVSGAMSRRTILMRALQRRR